MKFIKNTTGIKDLDDAALLLRYKSTGSLDALGMLYNRYMHLVYGVCLNYFKEEEASKDAVMQIFEELVVKLKIHEVQNFKSWLHVLTRNHCLMALRKLAKNNTVSIDDTFVENTDFVHLDIDDTKEKQLTVMEKCMETLTEEQRKSVDLFYLQEKCYKEVAELTGYEMVKVKSYIQNGKRNLKICIEKNSSE
ncbi:RNA polymerase sigma-70 factor (ECF subfamily) [Pedobacter cryoconitis]|uniref:RNA polymerase sigma-70 factor (ECF subfamily) n=1 Tax=Pedobacter cryoconitis TaxID=188932 RepID=A0A7W8ZKG7_9SPHI|nr:sigma-70 family RNA polymerase sigma factor [Pedobacter cryoconitis]MBB5635697.1 RNA polymerase sigma-70 factor (ECF subfamily) [Pedobacter cryoconitis]MBB6273429.1 RNA polymerase sigma-70 factor (ECF subfamily) [Pedobacter cryoconitis]